MITVSRAAAMLTLTTAAALAGAAPASASASVVGALNPSLGNACADLDEAMAGTSVPHGPGTAGDVNACPNGAGGMTGAEAIGAEAAGAETAAAEAAFSERAGINAADHHRHAFDPTAL